MSWGKRFSTWHFAMSRHDAPCFFTLPSTDIHTVEKTHTISEKLNIDAWKIPMNGLIWLMLFLLRKEVMEPISNYLLFSSRYWEKSARGVGEWLFLSWNDETLPRSWPHRKLSEKNLGLFETETHLKFAFARKAGPEKERRVSLPSIYFQLLLLLVSGRVDLLIYDDWNSWFANIFLSPKCSRFSFGFYHFSSSLKKNNSKSMVLHSPDRVRIPFCNGFWDVQSKKNPKTQCPPPLLNNPLSKRWDFFFQDETHGGRNLSMLPMPLGPKIGSKET